MIGTLDASTFDNCGSAGASMQGGSTIVSMTSPSTCRWLTYAAADSVARRAGSDGDADAMLDRIGLWDPGDPER